MKHEVDDSISLKNWALSAYVRVTDSLLRINTVETLMQDVCEEIASQDEFPLVWVGKTINDEKKSIEIAAASGRSRDYLDGIEISWSEDTELGNGPTGRSIRTKLPQVIEDTQSAVNYKHWSQRALDYNILSTISIPILENGEVFGTLNIYSSFSYAFDASIIPIFKGLADHISWGISRIRNDEYLNQERIKKELAMEKFSNVLESIINAMTKAMEERDSYTTGHESRVSKIAIAIAKELGWDDKHILELKMAGIVHDIGKISLPLELLIKPTKLSKYEFELIKEHAEKGYNILKDIPFDSPIATIVRQHHEKIDGSGYPFGLKEDEILIESKILAVADIVEAMSAHRPNRPALGLEVALKEIEKQAGVTLDEDIVKVCLSLFREKGFKLPV